MSSEFFTFTYDSQDECWSLSRDDIPLQLVSKGISMMNWITFWDMANEVLVRTRIRTQLSARLEQEISTEKKKNKKSKKIISLQEDIRNIQQEVHQDWYHIAEKEGPLLFPPEIVGEAGDIIVAPSCSSQTTSSKNSVKRMTTTMETTSITSSRNNTHIDGTDTVIFIGFTFRIQHQNYQKYTKNTMEFVYDHQRWAWNIPFSMDPSTSASKSTVKQNIFNAAYSGNPSDYDHTNDFDDDNNDDNSSCSNSSTGSYKKKKLSYEMPQELQLWGEHVPRKNWFFFYKYACSFMQRTKLREHNNARYEIEIKSLVHKIYNEKSLYNHRAVRNRILQEARVKKLRHVSEQNVKNTAKGWHNLYSGINDRWFGPFGITSEYMYSRSSHKYSDDEQISNNNHQQDPQHEETGAAAYDDDANDECDDHCNDNHNKQIIGLRLYFNNPNNPNGRKIISKPNNNKETSNKASSSSSDNQKEVNTSRKTHETKKSSENNKNESRKEAENNNGDGRYTDYENGYACVAIGESNDYDDYEYYESYSGNTGNRFRRRIGTFISNRRPRIRKNTKSNSSITLNNGEYDDEEDLQSASSSRLVYSKL